MADPAKLAFSTSFDAFKNNDYKTGFLTVTGTIAAGATATYSGSVTLDRTDSVTQIYYETSVNSDYHSVARNYLLTSDARIDHSNGSTPTLPGTAAYSLLFTTAYSANTLTLSVTTRNPNANTLTVVTEIVSFEVYTFVAPFDN